MCMMWNNTIGSFPFYLNYIWQVSWKHHFQSNLPKLLIISSDNIMIEFREKSKVFSFQGTMFQFIVENIFINYRNIIAFNKQTNHMYSNMAIRISITEILTEELLMSVLVSSLSSLTLMKKSSPYRQLSTFMFIMSLIIDCMQRYTI